jgi:hypothetical protein
VFYLLAQLVEALRYKPEDRGFDSRWCHWNFLLTLSFRSHYGPGVDSASNRNEYREYFLESKVGRCWRPTVLPPSCADCLQIWQPQPPETLRACPGLYWDCFTLFLLLYGGQSLDELFYDLHRILLRCLSFSTLRFNFIHFLQK